MRNIAIADRSEWTIERDAAPAVPDPKRPRRLRDSGSRRSRIRVVLCPGLDPMPLVVTMAAGPHVLRVSGRDVAPGANIRVAATGLTAGFTGDLVWDDADLRPLRASLPTAPAASA